MYLVDTDVVVSHLNGRADAVALLNLLLSDGLAISVITFGEIYEGRGRFITQLAEVEGQVAWPLWRLYRRLQLLLASAHEHRNSPRDAEKRQNRQLRIGSYEARCLCPTWKRMKMGGILDGEASETRSWRSGAASPITKLIRVRPRTDDCMVFAHHHPTAYPPSCPQ